MPFISRMWTWWVSRSGSAPVSLSEPKISVHSSKGRFVVTRMEPRSQRWLKTSKRSSAPVRDRGTKPGSSMIRIFRRESCLCKFSSRLSSRASIISWTRAAAAVKPTDNPLWQAARPRPSPQSDVGLAGAAVADGDDVPTALDVFAAGQLHHQRLVHRGDGGEVEGVQALDGREAGGADPALHHALVALDELQFGQPEQALRVVHILGGALGGHLPVLPQEAGQLQFLQVVFQEQGGAIGHAAIPDSRVM